MRTFIERQLFGSGDRVVTWVWMAGMAWLVVAICYAAVGMGLVLTIFLFPFGLGLAVFALCPSVWFIGQLWVYRSAFWTICSVAYGVGLTTVLFNIAGKTWGIEVWAALIPAGFSAVASWELLRGPRYRRPFVV
ncbi:MAG: hypothetical protein ACRDGI_02590 [Candidatus Limnocylindrales bacterium]